MNSVPFARLVPRSQAILRKVLNADNGIGTRHLALDPLTDAFEITPDRLHERFKQNAPALATEAAKRALVDANCSVGEIDALLISTCTGYLCPGLTSYVHEALGLRPDAQLLDLVGQGCGAALPNLRTAEALIAAQRAKKILSICVEVCSAAFYLDDDAGVLISACLFGDGAGAAVLSSQPQPGKRKVEWKLGTSLLRPEDRELLRFDQKDGMLRNILKPQVPGIAAGHARTLLATTLEAAGIKRPEITGWIMHTGGRDVLVALRQQLGLTDHDTRHSSAVLHEYGNISSPTVFFVLQNALRDQSPGGLWWMSAFGAGFSCHGAVLAVE